MLQKLALEDSLEFSDFSITLSDPSKILVVFLSQLHQIVHVVLWHNDIANSLLLFETLLRFVVSQLLSVEDLPLNCMIRIFFDLCLQ